MLNSDNSIHGQGYQNYDGWILWQMNWQMLMLMTGKGKTQKTEKSDGKLLKKPRPTQRYWSTDDDDGDDDDMCV